MAASAVDMAAHTLLRSLLRRPLRLSAAASFSFLRHNHPNKLSFCNLPHFSHSLSFSSSSSSSPLHTALSTPKSQLQSEIKPTYNELDSESEAGSIEINPDEEEQGHEIESENPGIAPWNGEEREVPKLTIKEKKELGSYANSLGDKLKSQQVGKSGITNNVVLALDETLEKNELLKLKIQKSCPGELEDVVSLLERATGSAAVFQIGRIVIFYRPSVTKQKKEEKKAQNRKLFEQKRKKAQAAFMMRRKEQSRRPGSSRNFERAPS